MKLAVLAIAATLSLSSCATRHARVWRVERQATDLIVTPPATQSKIAFRDCNGKQKLTPSSLMALRGVLIRSEDDGCLRPGGASAQLRNALEAQPASAQAIVRTIYGTSGAYADLHPGWRLRVVTPLFRSGGYRPRTEVTEGKTGPGSTLTVRTDGDFLGVENSWYAIEQRPRGPGVQIRFSGAEAVIDGVVQQREKPAAALFRQPSDARRFRLLYLTRVSAADHDMLVLSGTTADELDKLTADVQADPERACKRSVFCDAIPVGIAVRVEMPVTVDGTVKWFHAGATARDARAVALLRPWRGKATPVEGDIDGVPLIEGDIVRTR